MADKKVSIIIAAKNALAAGLSSAGASLQKFGKSAARIGKMFAGAFLVAGTAVAGFAAKALSAFAVQDRATKQVEASFRAYGEEIKANTENVKRFAAAIQDETGKSDESTMALAAKLKLLGVETEGLEAATKATIALGKAGMGEEQAAKAVAAAIEGDFQALTRYIPALKTATTDAEKAAAVNDFVTKGYAAQKDELNSLSGQWEAFKGRVGDVWEIFGDLIAQDATLSGMLKNAADKVKEFGESVQRWMAGGGVARAIATWENFFEAIRHGFAVTSARINIGIASLMDGIQSQLPKLKAFVLSSLAVVAPTVANVKNAAMAVKDAIEKNADVAQDRTLAAMAVMEQEEARHAAKVAELTAKQTGEVVTAAQAEVAVVEKAQEQIIVAKENTAKREAALRKKAQSLAEQLADKEKAIAERAANEEIAAMEKAQAKREEVAKKTVQGILAEQEAQRAVAKQWERDQAQARRLRAREAAGAKLSKKQQEWLAAFGQIEAAKGGLQVGAQNIQHAKDQLAMMQDQGKRLGDIKAELEKTRQQLIDLNTRR